MYYRKPYYYNEFNCIADRCPDTCCAGWSIVIDDRTMAVYNKLPEKDKNYLLSHIDEHEQVYKRFGDRCSFLDENNLCKLYTNMGEHMFCKTCKRYPRHFEEYGNLVEAALSMSCPEAARIIVDRKDTDSFAVKEDKAKISPNKDEVDDVLLGNLLAARKHIFDIMSDRKFDISMRLYRVLLYSSKVQKLVYSYERLGKRAKKKYTVAEFMLKLDMLTKKELVYASEKSRIAFSVNKYRAKMLNEYFDMLLGLENINDDWPVYITSVKKMLYCELDCDKYIKIAEEFNDYMKDRMYEYEHIFNYFIYTYFLGGVYDYNIHAMVKLAILSTIIIREMGIYSWITNDRKFDITEQLRLCWLYSRQVEHSDDNLMALEGILNAHPIFAENNIIKIF